MYIGINNLLVNNWFQISDIHTYIKTDVYILFFVGVENENKPKTRKLNHKYKYKHKHININTYKDKRIESASNLILLFSTCPRELQNYV